MPVGIKDPAEFLEQRKKVKTADDEFREEVVDLSLEWTDWYIEHLLSGYDASAIRGARGSFGDVFERLADFLATFTNAAERTKRACELASHLAEIIAKESDTGQASNTVRVQLESDLVEKASSIADEKAGVARRIAMIDGGSTKDIQAKLSSLSRGDGMSGDDGNEKLARKALRKIEGNQPQVTKKRVERTNPDVRSPSARKSERGSRYKMKRPSEKDAPSLTPHFSGFNLHETDAMWLGFIDEKVCAP
jgi:hypothetical protein